MLAGVIAQAGSPKVERVDYGAMQTGDLFGLEALREGDGRELGSVQDFVGVGIANATEDVGISKGALQRVILACEGAGEVGFS